MVWDLHPAEDISSPGADYSASPPAIPRPTAYVIAFPYPLTTINSHPSTSKEFLVSDSRGSIFLTDWRSDPEESDEQSWRHHSLLELVEPRALSASLGHAVQWTGAVGWRRDTVEMYVILVILENLLREPSAIFLTLEQGRCYIWVNIFHLGHV